MTTEEKFGRAVRQQMAALNWNGSMLAVSMQEAGHAMDPSGVSRLLAGKRAVRLSEAVTIAKVLGVSLDALFDVRPRDDRVNALVAELASLTQRWGAPT